MTVCYACSAELIPDHAPGDDGVTYQFDNALWLGLFGGYAMFCDNIDAKFPTNTDARWLRDATGEYLSYIDPAGRVHPVDNPDWQPEYRENRVLPGHPDYEAVICHDCAHALCDAVPWLSRLIEPYKSHAHTTDYHDRHPDHWGWDYAEPAPAVE